jgi:hypothetical protein
MLTQGARREIMFPLLEKIARNGPSGFLKKMGEKGSGMHENYKTLERIWLHQGSKFAFRIRTIAKNSLSLRNF